MCFVFFSSLFHVRWIVRAALSCSGAMPHIFIYFISFRFRRYFFLIAFSVICFSSAIHTFRSSTLLRPKSLGSAQIVCNSTAIIHRSLHSFLFQIWLLRFWTTTIVILLFPFHLPLFLNFIFRSLCCKLLRSFFFCCCRYYHIMSAHRNGEKESRR